jgi:hypothetical protein
VSRHYHAEFRWYLGGRQHWCWDGCVRLFESTVGCFYPRHIGVGLHSQLDEIVAATFWNRSLRPEFSNVSRHNPSPFFRLSLLRAIVTRAAKAWIFAPNQCGEGQKEDRCCLRRAAYPQSALMRFGSSLCDGLPRTRFRASFFCTKLQCPAQ